MTLLKIPTSTASFNQIVKAPTTYMLMVAVSLVWFFVTKFGGVSDQVNKNCEEEKVQLRTELTTERSKTDMLINAILVKNGVINSFVKAADSLDISLGVESKEIVNKNKNKN